MTLAFRNYLDAVLAKTDTPNVASRVCANGRPIGRSSHDPKLSNCGLAAVRRFPTAKLNVVARGYWVPDRRLECLSPGWLQPRAPTRDPRRA